MSDVASQVKGPAIGLIVVGALGVVGALIGMLNAVIGFGMSEQMAEQAQQMPEWFRPFMGGNMILSVFLNVLGGACSAFIVYCGLQMMKLRGHGLAMTGSILAMIPCLSPCCCIGLPIGIWALVVLNKPEVRAAFEATPQN